MKNTDAASIASSAVIAGKIAHDDLQSQLRQEKATAELRFNKAGTLQQRWEIRELSAGVIGHEWRDVPTVDE